MNCFFGHSVLIASVISCQNWIYLPNWTFLFLNTWQWPWKYNYSLKRIQHKKFRYSQSLHLFIIIKKLKQFWYFLRMSKINVYKAGNDLLLVIHLQPGLLEWSDFSAEVWYQTFFKIQVWLWSEIKRKVR